MKRALNRNTILDLHLNLQLQLYGWKWAKLSLFDTAFVNRQCTSSRPSEANEVQCSSSSQAITSEEFCAHTLPGTTDNT